MIANQSSRTAEYMALFRALETARPAGRRLFADPLARSFLSPSLRAAAILAALPVPGATIPWLIDRRWPGARPSGVARTRLIDDMLAEALADGIGQIVLLGAGFDSRAYRIPALRKTRVYEVDHPATLAAKRARVEAALGPQPHVTFSPIDFNTQPLGDVLSASGLDTARPVFFIWEGVTHYLTAPAVDSTLRVIAACGRGSRVAFTYIHRDALSESARFAGKGAITRTLSRAGERWTFGLDPADLPAYLAECGLRLLEDISSTEYRARYMGRHGHHLTGYEFYRAALAERMSNS